MAGRLQGRVCVITGGCGGVGSAMVARFREEGAIVIPADMTASNDAEYIELDVCSRENWQRAVAMVIKRHGRLDVLVNNAGIEGCLDDVTLETVALGDWRRVQAVNVEGPLLGFQAVAPVMKRQGGGAVLNVSSLASELPTPYMPAYGASKAALRQLTLSMAAYGIADNIRCNALLPGQIRTRMAASIIGSMTTPDLLAETERRFIAQIPMGRWGEPADVAAAALFLVSDDASYVTGTHVVVSGGMNMS